METPPVKKTTDLSLLEGKVKQLEFEQMLATSTGTLDLKLSFQNLMPCFQRPIVRLHVPSIAPTVNNYYKRNKMGGLYLTPAATIFRVLVKKLVESLKIPFTKGKVVLLLEFRFTDFKKRDADNYVKGTQDALNGVLIEDDSLIDTVIARKCEVCKTDVNGVLLGRGYTDITIFPLMNCK